ncbi:MAG: hypothetical protein AAF411_30335, partial [Myxococcota bacterium]
MRKLAIATGILASVLVLLWFGAPSVVAHYAKERLASAGYTCTVEAGGSAFDLKIRTLECDGERARFSLPEGASLQHTDRGWELVAPAIEVDLKVRAAVPIRVGRLPERAKEQVRRLLLFARDAAVLPLAEARVNELRLARDGSAPFVLSDVVLSPASEIRLQASSVARNAGPVAVGLV